MYPVILRYTLLPGESGRAQEAYTYDLQVFELITSRQVGICCAV